MTMNRIWKWVAAGVLALGAVPAVGLARTHASESTAVTVTPASMEAPINVMPVASHVRSKKNSSTHRRGVSSRRRSAARRHRVQVRRPSHAASHRLHKHASRKSHQRA